MLVRIAKILTVGSILLIAILYISEWINNGIKELEDVLGLILFLSALTLNFLALNKKTPEEYVKMRSVSEVWPFILFKRLALQEKKKIEELENRNAC